MKKLLLIGLMFFALGADELPPTEVPPEEPIEIPTEESLPEVTPEPTIEVFPEIPPEPTPEPAIITGCTDPIAANYLPPGEGYIVRGDNSCIYFEGCMDKRALNYMDAAVKDDGSCMYLTGCTDPNAVNYVDYSAYGLCLMGDDGSCVYPDGYEPEPPKESKPEHHEVWIYPESEPVYIFEDYSDMIEANMATEYE